MDSELNQHQTFRDVAIALGAALIGAAATVAFEAIRRRYTKAKVLDVKRVVEPDDPDLMAALALYERSIPPTEQDKADSILRWFKEVAEETREHRCKLVDYFLVARYRGTVCAFIYAHYYPSSELMFISYLVVDRKIPVARGSAASSLLLHNLLREIQKKARACKGVVFEVDRPGLSAEAERYRRRARIRLFERLGSAAGITVRGLDFDYRQPQLDLWEEGHPEEPMTLMYGRLGRFSIQQVISRSEVARAVEFVYSEIYGDHFEHDARLDAEFRQYVASLYQQIVATLPEKVPVLTDEGEQRTVRQPELPI